MRAKNPFAQVIAEAAEEPSSTASPEPKKALRPSNTAPKARRSAPSSARRKTTAPTPTKESELARLQTLCKNLTRENETLKARLRARAKAKEPLVEQVVEVESTEVEVDEPKVRYSVGASRYTKWESIATVPVANLCNGAPPSLRFVAFAVYGAAALDGECAGLVPACWQRGYRVRPTELCAVGGVSGFEPPWAALPVFACPDGITLELLDATAALDRLEKAPPMPHVTALTHGDSQVMYLVTYVVPSLERFARPAAVSRGVLVAAERRSSGVDEDDDGPLAAAKHLLPPLARPAADSDRELVGSRAYAALTLRHEACGDVLRFLRHIAGRDRRADAALVRARRGGHPLEHCSPPSVRWRADWDDDDYEDDGDTQDDDLPPEALMGPTRATHLSFQSPQRLASFVSRARDDDRVWRWLTTLPSGRKTDVLGVLPDDDGALASPPTTAKTLATSPPDSMKTWAVAAALSLLPAHVVCRALDALIREQSLVVVADHVARASAVALGLVSLLDPLEWQGSLIATLPASDVDLLGSPVPFVAGCSTATAAVAHANFPGGRNSPLKGVNALFIDRQHDAQFASGNGPPNPTLLRDIQDPVAALDRGADVIRLLAGLTDAEKSALAAARASFKTYVRRLLGDLDPPDDTNEKAGYDAHAWKRYGEDNLATGHFEFVPSWFLAPIQATYELQHDLAHTQMFVSHVHKLRLHALM